MGITKQDCRLLFYAKSQDVNYGRTLTLGRLRLYVTATEIKSIIKHSGTSMLDKLGKIDLTGDYSESLFKILGANKIDTMDYSDYEGASLIHDMNNPLPDEIKKQYSMVLDSGTLEHIYNFPVAIKNCMDAITIGGHFISIAPVNNQMGHGFYQFSPELYFRIFSKENGFEVIKMLLWANVKDAEIYEVSDPQVVKGRVQLVNNYPTTMCVIAKKIDDTNTFTTPLQSDYVTTWGQQKSQSEDTAQSSNIRQVYRRFVPVKIRDAMRRLFDRTIRSRSYSKALGFYDPDHFKKIEI